MRHLSRPSKRNRARCRSNHAPAGLCTIGASFAACCALCDPGEFLAFDSASSAGLLQSFCENRDSSRTRRRERFHGAAREDEFVDRAGTGRQSIVLGAERLETMPQASFTGRDAGPREGLQTRMMARRNLGFSVDRTGRRSRLCFSSPSRGDSTGRDGRDEFSTLHDSLRIFRLRPGFADPARAHSSDRDRHRLVKRKAVASF
jgi:hypothetical protein